MSIYTVTTSIKNMILGAYECQKKIIINRRIICELDLEGKDTSKFKNENMCLQEKLKDYQCKLRKKYQSSSYDFIR